MDLPNLQKQIVDNKLDQFYIFTGPEIGIMNIYIDKMLNVSGRQRVVVDSVEQAVAKLTRGRVSKEPRCFIVRDDKQFLKEDKSWVNVQMLSKSGHDALIIIYTSMDKRSKFWKHYQNEAVIFDFLTPQVLASYIHKEVPLSLRNCIDLAEMCECDYNRIMLEVDKINTYWGTMLPYSADEAFIKLKEQGVIHQPIGDITFKFTDAIALRQHKQALMYLELAKAKGEPEIMVLSVLYNTFKQIIMVQGLGHDQSEPARRTGLTPFQVKLAKEKQGHYTIGELINAIRVIRSAEKDIKTGRLDIDVALDYVIVNIM